MFPLSVSPTSIGTFYPPLNSTSFISNVSLGSYGGIYSAPATQASYPSKDGIYDYCSMPHPNKDLYSLPSPVADQTVQADIVYLEYLQRHQRRTPYNILPSGEVTLPHTRVTYQPARMKNTNATTFNPFSMQLHLTIRLFLSLSTPNPTPTQPTHSLRVT